MIPLGRSIATILIPAFLLYWHGGAGKPRTRAPGCGCMASTWRGCSRAMAGPSAPGVMPKWRPRRRCHVVLCREAPCCSYFPSASASPRLWVGVLQRGACAGCGSCSRCTHCSLRTGPRPCLSSGKAHRHPSWDEKPFRSWDLCSLRASVAFEWQQEAGGGDAGAVSASRVQRLGAHPAVAVTG